MTNIFRRKADFFKKAFKYHKIGFSVIWGLCQKATLYFFFLLQDLIAIASFKYQVLNNTYGTLGYYHRNIE